MRGNISGRQDLSYIEEGGRAYSVPVGTKVAASGYSPRIIAKVMHYGRRDSVRFFQVRTRSSVNMTAAMRESLALMGGAGAIYAAIVRDKTSAIYQQCLQACPANMTLRAFLIPLIKNGLTAKSEHITIASGIYIVNPWVSSDPPTVSIPTTIIDKFNSVLSNS